MFSAHAYMSQPYEGNPTWNLKILCVLDLALKYLLAKTHVGTATALVSAARPADDSMKIRGHVSSRLLEYFTCINLCWL